MYLRNIGDTADIHRVQGPDNRFSIKTKRHGNLKSDETALTSVRDAASGWPLGSHGTLPPCSVHVSLGPHDTSEANYSYILML
jgi:hypothetical protein